jgi:hypothetical protein
MKRKRVTDWESTKNKLPLENANVIVRYRGMEFKATFRAGKSVFTLENGKDVTFEEEEMFWTLAKG